MKKRLLHLLSFTLLSVFALSLVGCSEPENVPETPAVSISEVEATLNSVTFTLTPKNAVKVEYTVTKEGEEPSTTPEVYTGTDATSITVDDLESEVTYVIRAVAISADDTKSTEVTTEFTTETISQSPSVTISEIIVISNTVKFTLTPKNAIKIEYTVTKKGDEPSSPKVIESAEATTETVDNLVDDVTYVIRAVAIDQDNVSSDEITKEFTTNQVFYKNVLIQKFAGTWCSPCIFMTSALVELKKHSPGRVVVMSMHAGASDPFEIPETTTLVNLWGISSYPTAIVDYRETEKLSADLLALKKSLDETLTDHPATSGIAITSSVDGNTINIESKLILTEAGEYEVICVVVENDINLAGTVGTSDEKYHYVLRDVAPDDEDNDFGGIALENVEVGKEITQTFEITAKSNWKLENCEIIVYIQKKDGTKFYTDNVATCSVNGSVNYAYEK